MAVLRGLNLAGKPALPAARAVPSPSKEFEQVLENETRQADAEIAQTDEIINSTPGGVHVEATEENIADESEKLSRLVEDDFPFDESQLAAVGGLVQQQYACMIGAAGTGKTTLEKKLVDMLSDGLGEVDVSQYWKRGVQDEHDDYEIPERLIPSILMCSFTGRSTQMTKKNFPTEWHPNIMTIHRALGFYPEFYADVDEESGEMVNKRRFVPAYTADNLMPWDIIIIDEAGMLGLDLWHQLWAATKRGARIYMIGDINQLPPTHGKSILGFALAKWPTWELTHVHRQQGANNSIVDNAHRVLNGLRPVSDSPNQLSIKPLVGEKDPKKKMMPMLETLQFLANDKDWRFVTVDVDEEHKVAAIRMRQLFKLLHGKIYDPNRDFVITPINGFEQTAPGYSIGQAPMNQELVLLLNQENPRYLIDAGREKQNFALGDKVMATINDYEVGITNGMTGIITKITEHGGYTGDVNRYGLITEVNDYIAGLYNEEDDQDVEFSLEEMVADSQAGMDALKEKDKKKAGPASHIIEVTFGEGDHSFTVDFASQSQVASLMLAYVATCHKLQGGEAPLVFVICHQSTKRPLNREWLYTAITRGSHRVVLLQTRQGVGFAVGKQNIKGKTLKEKITSFNDLMKTNVVEGVNFGSSVKVKLPEPVSLVEDSVSLPVRTGLDLAHKPAIQEEPKPEPVRPVFNLNIANATIIVNQASPPPPPPTPVKDGGTIHAEKPIHKVLGFAPPKIQAVPQVGAAMMHVHLNVHRDMAQRLLPPPDKPKNPLAALLKKSGETQAQKAAAALKAVDGPIESKPVNRLSALIAKQAPKK